MHVALKIEDILRATGNETLTLIRYAAGGCFTGFGTGGGVSALDVIHRPEMQSAL